MEAINIIIKPIKIIIGKMDTIKKIIGIIKIRIGII